MIVLLTYHSCDIVQFYSYDRLYRTTNRDAKRWRRKQRVHKLLFKKIKSNNVCFFLTSSYIVGFIHLVRTQNFPKINISDPLIRTRTCSFQRVRNVSFLGNFAYVLNGWSLWEFINYWIGSYTKYLFFSKTQIKNHVFNVQNGFRFNLETWIVSWKFILNY